MNSPTNGYRHHSQKEKKILSHKDACHPLSNSLYLLTSLSLTRYRTLNLLKTFIQRFSELLTTFVNPVHDTILPISFKFVLHRNHS